MALKASQLKVGDTHSERVCENLSRTQIVQYAGASGDYNPLHSDPATARAAGFERPILHGLATFGVTGHGLVKRLADSDPTALRAMGGRFSSPVFPGETLRLEIWRDGPGLVTFRTTVPARSVVVVNNGFAEFAA